MAAYWTWWALAAVLVGAELMTGTFYLLAVGVAFVAGGIAAWMGASVPVQLLIGGVLGVALHDGRAPLADAPGAAARRRRSTSGIRCACSAGRTTAARASTIAARSGMPNWRRPARARAETMYIVGTRGSTLLIADRRA